jgi:hypothetical protein
MRVRCRERRRQQKDPQEEGDDSAMHCQNVIAGSD